MFEMNDLQKDALTEAFNISIGRAAGTLNSMLNEEVSLSVPDVRFATTKNILEIIPLSTEREICYVSQVFKGNFFSTEAILLFAEDESLELVRILLGSDTPLEKMSGLEHEAMIEVGNVILNACIGSLANSLKDEMTSTIPELVVCQATELFNDMHLSVDSNKSLLVVFIDFSVETKSITGYLILVLELHSFEKFFTQLLKGFN